MLEFNLPTEKSKSSIIKVIGVGGGGSNAVNHMYKQGIKGVDFYVCNTDSQALESSPVPHKIQLGTNLTEGRGAGSRPEVGRNAALENLDDVKKVLNDNTKMVFITAGMGGGTGTGAAPVIAAAAKELGILTVGIVTIPFVFEGPKRKSYADNGLDELSRNVDTLLVINNEKVRLLFNNLKMSEAFGKANDILTIAAKSIAELITVSGYINVDFEDVKTVMTNSGVAIMGSGVASGEGRARKAVEMALESPLLNDNHITGASNILLYMASGSDEITTEEMSEITAYVTQQAGPSANINWGYGYDDSIEDGLMVTIIATGFEKNKEVMNSVAVKQPEIIKHSLTEASAPIQPVLNVIKTTEDTSILDENGEEPNSDSFVVSEIKETVVTTTTEEFSFELKTISDTDSYRHEELNVNASISKSSTDEAREEKLRIHRERVEKLKSFNWNAISHRGAKAVEDLENTPSYKRKNIPLDFKETSSEQVQAKHSLGLTENNEPTFRPNNSFLNTTTD